MDFAAINEEFAGGDETGLVEANNNVGDFLGGSHPTERDAARPLVKQCPAWSGWGANFLSPGMSGGLGITVLTRMPRSLSSAAQVRVNELSTALLATYTPNARVPFEADVDLVRMTGGPLVQHGQGLLHGENGAPNADAEGLIEVFRG